MRLRLLAAGLLLALGNAATAQQLGTVRMGAPGGHEDARIWYEACKRGEKGPACGLRQVADFYCAITVRTEARPPCCMLDNDATNDLIKQAFLAWGDDNPDLLDIDVNEALRTALSAAFPCSPAVLETIPRPGELALFPPGTFLRQSWLDTFRRDWYSEHLRAMGEPALSEARQQDIALYRILVLPSFGRSWLIRVAKQGGAITLRYKELTGQGGFDPGRLAIDERRTMSGEQWDEFVDLIDASDFWRLPTSGGTRGLDGTEVIVEGIKNGRYHVVDRWVYHPTAGAIWYALQLTGHGASEQAQDLVRQGLYGRAEGLMNADLSLVEHAFGPDHLYTGRVHHALALIHLAKDWRRQAKHHFERAIAILQQELGPDHPDLIADLEGYAALLRRRDEIDHAEKLEARAKAIRAKTARDND